MVLYAYDERGDPIYASNAEERQSYTCCYCHTTVRVRKGLSRIPHYYHLALPASCRLHGKSQDHLFAQLALQKLLPPGEATLEKPFFSILRVADLVWEPHKLIFEIQCSNILQQEVEERVKDYAKSGYQIVWILDDRIFNRKIVRPAEKWMRGFTCYYATLRGLSFPYFYDQFEIFREERRILKGHPLKIRVERPKTLPEVSWDKEEIPNQVVQKGTQNRLYFEGDLLHRATLSLTSPFLGTTMQNLRSLELRLEKDPPRKDFFEKILRLCFIEPIGRLMHFLQQVNAKWD